MTTQHDKAKRWQFGVRDMFHVTAIIALCVVWWLETQRSASVSRELKDVTRELRETQAVHMETMTYDMGDAVRDELRELAEWKRQRARSGAELETNKATNDN